MTEIPTSSSDLCAEGTEAGVASSAFLNSAQRRPQRNKYHSGENRVGEPEGPCGSPRRLSSQVALLHMGFVSTVSSFWCLLILVFTVEMRSGFWMIFEGLLALEVFHHFKGHWRRATLNFQSLCLTAFGKHLCYWSAHL